MAFCRAACLLEDELQPSTRIDRGKALPWRCFRVFPTSLQRSSTPCDSERQRRPRSFRGTSAARSSGGPQIQDCWSLIFGARSIYENGR